MPSAEKVIHKELSYQTIGSIYKVYNSLGYGYREKIYERALAKEFHAANLAYEQQKAVPLLYNGEKIGTYIFDFIIENKLVLELKVAERFRIKDFQQIMSYLKSSRLQLGILALITKQGIRYRRILNSR